MARRALTCTAVVCAGLLAASAGASRAEHLIAVVTTKGSLHQPYGHQVLAGAEAAVARVNAQGGVLGHPLRVVAWTEDCSRQRALIVADEIARLQPVAVVGHLCAGAAIAARPIYTKAGILLIAPGVRHAALTGAGSGGLVLRVAGRDDQFAPETARFIARRYPGKSVAIVADRTRQALELAAGVRAELVHQQIVVSFDERVESGEKTYDAVAARIRESGAGVVIMPAQPIELGVLVQSLRLAGVDAPLVGSEILAVPAIEPVARQEGDRLVLMLPWTGLEAHAAEKRPNAVRPGADCPVATIAVPSGTAVSPAESASDRGARAVRSRSEAAIEVWARAAIRAGTVEADGVGFAARMAPADTVVGPLVFDEAGDAVVPSYLPHSWTEGGWCVLPP